MWVGHITAPSKFAHFAWPQDRQGLNLHRHPPHQPRAKESRTALVTIKALAACVTGPPRRKHPRAYISLFYFPQGCVGECRAPPGWHTQPGVAVAPWAPALLPPGGRRENACDFEGGHTVDGGGSCGRVCTDHEPRDVPPALDLVEDNTRPAAQS